VSPVSSKSRLSPSSGTWPASPLAAAQRAFDLLCCPPAPLAFDGRGFDGLPDRIMDLAQLKAVLLRRATPPPVRDAVWRELVTRARRDGPAWVVAAVGLAMPGLVAAAGALAAGWRGDRADLDAEMLVGFVERLRTVDVDAPRVCGRLLDAAVRAGRRARAAEGDTAPVHVDRAWSWPPARPWDHPDWVLERAERAAVIDADEAVLIGATRLEDVPLAEVAAALGVSVQLARSWRRAAERRLVEAIRTGELDYVPLRARRRPPDARNGRGRPGVLGARWAPVG
jgi:hypothetical protein